MSRQLAAASYIYIHYALKKKSGHGGKDSCTHARKSTAVQVCWQTLIFSRSLSYIRISPECLPVNLNL
jgi:hypothetical protein